MTLTRLKNRSLQFLLFGGKGGVGKTTMAAATALELAKESRVLIFTTDPAPSLAASFGQAIGHEPTPVAGSGQLFAMEIDASRVLDEWKEQYGQEVGAILQQGTYLASAETEELLRLDIPGLDEVMSLKKIIDYMEDAQYQRYIVDTAPTGHTLRLLMLPELLDDWIKFLASLRWKYHMMTRRFAGREREEQADRFLLDMKKTVRRVRALLRDPERTEFVVITTAQKMAICETEQLLAGLARMHIPSHHLIINNLFPQDASSFVEARRQVQAGYLAEIQQKFGRQKITRVGLQAGEVQGLTSLHQLAHQLFADTEEEGSGAYVCP
ncbi:MAG TPA: ArsA family ATPase [Ktedonobacteraceae bacterium]|jgi:arsenite-transporting ATPase